MEEMGHRQAATVLEYEDPRPQGLEDVLRWVRLNLFILLLGPLAGLVLGLIAQGLMTTVYQGRGSFVVNDLPFGETTRSSDAETQRVLVDTVILSIPNADMLRAVEQRLGVPHDRISFSDVDLPVSLRGRIPAANVRIEEPHNSRIGIIDATSQSPQFAADVVNAILAELLRFNKIGGKIQNVKLRLSFAKDKADGLLKQLVVLSGERIKLERENSELNDYTKRGFPLQSFPSFNDDATLNNLKTQLILVQSEYDRIASYTTRGELLDGKKSELDGLKKQIARHSDSLAAALRSQLEISSTQEKNIQAEVKETQDQLQTLQQLNAKLEQSFADPSLMAQLATADVDDVPDSSSNIIVIVDSATPQYRPVSPKLWLNLLLGGFFGVALAAGIAALRSWLDRQLTSVERVEQLTGLPCLAQLPKLPPAIGKRTARESEYSAGLGFLGNWFLRGQAATDRRQFIIGITPAKREQSCSELVAHLAVLLVQAEKKTLVVDLHVSSPRQEQLLGIAATRGLGEWLVTDEPLESHITYSTVRELALLPPGRIGTSLDDLLLRRSLAAALLDLLGRWDFILIDCPAVLYDWNAMLALPSGSPLVITADYNTTNADDVLHTARHARGPKWDVLGVVLQDCPEKLIQ